MGYEYILVEKESGVAILTMNRPAQLNAMNRQLSSELHDAVTQMVADDEVGCIVITGAGERAFTAGGDIHEQRENDRAFTQEELDARGAVRSRGSYEISACAKPTIGMMNGLAYGGGAVFGFWRLPTVGSIAPGPCPTRWAGRSPKSCCSRLVSSRRKRPTVLAC
jgi:enoyl-CoA hydratase/carnithine racemase